MYKHLLVICTLIWCLFLPTNSQGQSLADEQAFVSSLQEQVQCQYQQYRNRNVPICSLSVQIESTDDYIMASSMGSLTRNLHQTRRTLVLNMLVGDLQKGNITSGTSAGKTILLPLDYNTQAIKRILDREVRAVYNKAEKEFLSRQDLEWIEKRDSEPYQPEIEEPTITDVTLPSNAEISTDACAAMLKRSTSLWNTFGSDIQGSASLQYIYTRHYGFQSNGTVSIKENHATTLTLSAIMTDKEGFEIPLEKNFLAEYPADLPDENTILQEETSLFEQLQQLADVPAAKASICPVLLSNQAAALTLFAIHHIYPFNDNQQFAIKQDPSHFTIIANNATREHELLQRLKQTIKSQNKEFGYWIKMLRFSENGDLIPQILYRVYPDERANELVRGNIAITLSPITCPQISVYGNEPDCAIAPCGPFNTQPTVCCAPSVLCPSMELLPCQGQAKFHLLAPAQKERQSANPQFSTLITQIAQEEIGNFFEDTNLLDSPQPYDVEYLVTDALTYTVQSSLGSTLAFSEQPLRSVNTHLLVGNDRLNNEHLSLSQNGTPHPLPLDNDYANTLEALHQATENAYKQALLDYSHKLRILDNLPAEQQKNRTPDRSEAKRQSFFLEETHETANPTRLQNLANELSAQFNPKADELLCSGVNIFIFQSTAYFISAKNIQYAQPFNLYYIQWFAEVETAGGDTLRDCSYRVFRKMEEIPDLRNEITAMAEILLTFKKAPKLPQLYNGPVLFSGEAVSALLSDALLEETPSLIATHEPADKTGYSANYWEKMKNKQIASPIWNVSANYDKDTYDNTPLIGHYTVDAEGVPVMRETELIRRGILNEMLSSRSATVTGKYSNGHRQLAICNGQLETCTGAGILEVSGSRALEEDALFKEFLKQARASGHKYAYQIVKLGYREDQNGQRVACPLYAYRIKTSNGNREPIRISNGEQMDLMLLNRATAVSSCKNVFNILTSPQGKACKSTETPINGISTSIIVPAHVLLNLFLLPPE